MDYKKATIIEGEPFIAVLGEMKLRHEGVLKMAKWVEKYRPACLPEGGFKDIYDLLPHDGFDSAATFKIGDQEHKTQAGRRVTDNELLAEIAGRKCYDSFGEAGKKRLNSEYLRSMWEGRIPHRSTGYHAKFTFFFAEVSRRVSHELIRNYVGADRDEEGNPSQESTRFTHHPGIYIAHPAILDDADEMARFRARCDANYGEYQETIDRKVKKFTTKFGKAPVGIDKKRIYESTAGDLLMECGTSWIWTTNPMAALKFFNERDDEAADLEMARFARTFKRETITNWPNLFPTLVTSG